MGEIYAGDSFFTLSAAGQAGLAVLSLLLTAALIGFIWLCPRRAALFLAVILFWLFVWLSPQIYYEYYRLITDGLPAQIVVKDPPGSGQIVEMILFSGDPTLSAHGKGVLFWIVMVVAFVRRLGRPS